MPNLETQIPTQEETPAPAPTVADPQVKPAPPVLAAEPQLRQVLLETDGNMVRITKNTTAGNFELISILQAVIALVSRSK